MNLTHKKEIVAKVVSDKNKNMRVVEEKIRVIGHPLYRKLVNKTRKFHAFDEKNETKLGDIVKIQESRPYSRTVHWKIIEVLSPEKINID